MTGTNLDSDKTTQEMTFIPSELLSLARKQIESLLDVQKEMMQTLEGINHDLFVRATKEAELASEFVSKLAGARSVPDAAATWQDWVSKEMELLAADGRHIFEHGGKIVHASRRLLSNGVPSAGSYPTN